MKPTPGIPSDSIATASGPASATEEATACIQRIIEDAVRVGQLSGCTPEFVLRGIFEAIVDVSELDALAKTWNTPPLPTAVIAIPALGSDSRQSPHSASGPDVTDTSVSAKGAKLSKILRSTQDNPQWQSCVGFLISVADFVYAFRGGLAIWSRAGILIGRSASHVAAGLAISGGVR